MKDIRKHYGAPALNFLFGKRFAKELDGLTLDDYASIRARWWPDSLPELPLIRYDEDSFVFSDKLSGLGSYVNKFEHDIVKVEFKTRKPPTFKYFTEMTIYVPHSYMSNQSYKRDDMVPIVMPDFISKLYEYIENNAGTDNFLRFNRDASGGERQYDTDFSFPVKDAGLIRLISSYFTPNPSDEEDTRYGVLPQNLRNAIEYYKYTTNEKLKSLVISNKSVIEAIMLGLYREGHLVKTAKNRAFFPSIDRQWNSVSSTEQQANEIKFVYDTETQNDNQTNKTDLVIPNFIGRLFEHIDSHEFLFVRKIEGGNYKTDFEVPITDENILTAMKLFLTNGDLSEEFKSEISRHVTLEELSVQMLSQENISQIVKGLKHEGYLVMLGSNRAHFPAVTNYWSGGAAVATMGDITLHERESDVSLLNDSLASMSVSSETDYLDRMTDSEFRRTFPTETSTPEFRRRSLPMLMNTEDDLFSDLAVVEQPSAAVSDDEYEPGDGVWNISKGQFLDLIKPPQVLARLKELIARGDLQRAYIKARSDSESSAGGKWDQSIIAMRKGNPAPSYEQLELMMDELASQIPPSNFDAGAHAAAVAVALEIALFEALGYSVAFEY